MGGGLAGDDGIGKGMALVVVLPKYAVDTLY